jgi:F-box and WD-40 domain protein CDC4
VRIAEMAPYTKSLSFSERRGSTFDNELSLNTHVSKMPQQRPRGPPTPSMSTPAADFDQQLTGSPPPPPTPAASPGPLHSRPSWSASEQDMDVNLAQFRQYFAKCPGQERMRILADMLNLCTSQQLSFVHQFVSPLLKKDPFTSLPDELCLRVRCSTTLNRSEDAMTDRSRFFRLSTTPRSSPGHRRFRGDGGICSATT